MGGNVDYDKQHYGSPDTEADSTRGVKEQSTLCRYQAIVGYCHSIDNASHSTDFTSDCSLLRAVYK
jgi:hypothetical protein